MIFQVAAEEREHWAFLPVKPPEIPSQTSDWAWTDVDRLIEQGYREQGLIPVGETDKLTWLRRVSYNLTGLPPSETEIDAFLADVSAGAFERVVERLLASPHYGERWAQHWLDVVRYADTSGCSSDYPIPEAFRYRNYVIVAFNRDKPYDQFIREQIAGDLLETESDQERLINIVATGYLAMSRRFATTGWVEHLTLEDTIDNLGKTFLGLSVSCARCHDHTHDPISAKDYYGLYGIFKSTRYPFAGSETHKGQRDFVGLGTPEQEANLRALEKTLTALSKEVEKMRVGLVERKIPDEDRKETFARYEAKKAEVAELKKKMVAEEPPMAYAVGEGKAVNAKLQLAGSPQSKGDEVPRKFLDILGGQEVENTTESGRRELADWLTSPDNPLTARVMVNRIWQHHFGRGLVASPDDFGNYGASPTNLRLLDHLADVFVREGWSVKAMHRYLLRSRIYRLGSWGNAYSESKDPGNLYQWRMNRRRLSAEEIRDTVLLLSGELDRVPGGPHPFPPKNEWNFTQHTPFVAEYPLKKRSLYLMRQRHRRHSELSVYDGNDAATATGRRSESTTASQALFMLNSSLVHVYGPKFAVRVILVSLDPAERVRFLYRESFRRLPDIEETEVALAYLRASQQELVKTGEPPSKAEALSIISLVRMLLASNEFIYLD